MWSRSRLFGAAPALAKKKGNSATLIRTRGVDSDPGGEMLPESKFFEYIQVNLEYFIFKIFL